MASSPAEAEDAAVPASRRHTLAVLLPGVALMNVSLVGASTVGTLAAGLAGKAWGGAPAAAHHRPAGPLGFASARGPRHGGRRADLERAHQRHRPAEETVDDSESPADRSCR